MAHVAPENRPLVTAADGDAIAGIREVAGDVLTVGPAGDVSASYDGRRRIEGHVRLSGANWTVETDLSLLGAHQADNAAVGVALARQTMEEFDGDLPTETIEHGLRIAHWPGRFEILDRDPLTVLDGAHNPGACEPLADTLEEFEFDDLHLVFGALADKDHEGMVATLPTPDHAVVCRPDVDRAEETGVLAEHFEDAKATSDVTDALDEALSAAGPDDCVVVCG